MPWANAKVTHLLSVHRAMTTVVDDETAETASSNGYNEVVFMRNMETIDAFSSCVLPAKVEKAYMGEHINIMTQVLHIADGSLTQGITIQNAYMELQKGSKNVVMVVRNSTAYPQMLQKKAPVARAVAVISVPEKPPETRVWEGKDEPQDSHPPNLTTRQRQGKLFEELDLGGLNSWLQELTEDACQLLAEYHNVFSLEPAELGCTHSTKHMIRVTDDTPFKE